jgi:fructosamine-3-kinase
MQRKLGRKLAEMHKAGISDKGFGFMVDNTIGRYLSNYSIIESREQMYFLVLILIISTILSLWPSL